MIQRAFGRARVGARLACRLPFTRHGAALLCGTHATLHGGVDQAIIHTIDPYGQNYANQARRYQIAICPWTWTVPRFILWCALSLTQWAAPFRPPPSFSACWAPSAP